MTKVVDLMDTFATEDAANRAALRFLDRLVALGDASPFVIVERIYNSDEFGFSFHENVRSLTRWTLRGSVDLRPAVALVSVG